MITYPVSGTSHLLSSEEELTSTSHQREARIEDGQESYLGKLHSQKSYADLSVSIVLYH